MAMTARLPAEYRRYRRRAAWATLALAAGAWLLLPAAHAADDALVQVDGAWVRGTVEGQTGSGAYLRLTSREDARLVGAASPAADKVEIHEMRMAGDRMTMRRIDSLPLPAHVTVALEHDYHVMFIGLHQQLLPGQDVSLSLDVVDARGKHHAVAVHAPVRPLTTPPPGASHG